jgi:poly-gamma-glutamate capsule biosynthesis protein CapA/YwtB (metallophosphatase superfamily)
MISAQRMPGPCFLAKSAGSSGVLTEGAGQMSNDERSSNSERVILFLCGDVMTGRGIDQVLPHPGDPVLYESYMSSAAGYVELAEDAHGPIARPVEFSYIWGDALKELARVSPDVRIVNLETSVTACGDHWHGKGINYRMHPGNIPCLTAAGIDCCTLANNHVLDWGHAGLAETLDALDNAKLKHAGAGRNRNDAEAPAIMEIPGKGRVLVFACGSESSGIPRSWAAAEERPGVCLLPDWSEQTVRRLKESICKAKRRGDLAVASIHWGQNWGYAVPREQSLFAHRLIDEAGVDIVHGHSSHHVKGIEVYQGKPILYGCGDFLNDYEGIGGYGQFRDDLAVMYFVGMELSGGRLADLRMTPLRIERFRLNRASQEDALWLKEVFTREGAQFGTRVEWRADNTLSLAWG